MYFSTPACPPGTYKAIASPGDASTCTRCPDENHTTFKGSVDLSQCICKKGFRDFNNTGCVGKVYIQLIKYIYIYIDFYIVGPGWPNG